MAVSASADIYVFARKRPKLGCEANLNDVIEIENAAIRVTEIKQALDGANLIKKV